MANQALLKQINRARILNAIRTHTPVSRSRIADLLALDRKSVTNITGELLQAGLVHECGKKRTAKGRPLTMLAFRREANWVMGLCISAGSVEGVLLDLYGNRIATTESAFPLHAPLDSIRRAVHEAYRTLRDRAGDNLLEVGLAVPGIIDTNAGRVRRSVNLPALNGVDITVLLPDEAAAGPIFIEESSRAKALAEKWFGLGKRVPSFVCIELGIGVGAGIIQDRRLYSGDSGYVGEIGHIIIEKDGNLCPCGHRGCLEAYVSQNVLLDALKRSENRALRTLADAVDLSSEGEAVLRDAGYRLGIALSYLVNIICPPLIVLTGELTRFEWLIMPEIHRGLEEAALPACRERTQILMSTFTAAGAMGAAARALAELFEVEGHFYV